MHSKQPLDEFDKSTTAQSSDERSTLLIPSSVPLADNLLSALKKNAAMSFDVVIAREVLTAANFGAMVILSKNTTMPLIGTPLILALYRVFFSWLTTSLSSTAIAISQASGNPEEKADEISIINQQGVLYSLLLFGIAVAPAYFMKQILIDGLKQPEEAAETIAGFFRTFLPGMLAISLYSNDIMMLVSLGKTKFFMWSNIITSAIGLAACYPLIHTAQLGEKGFAYAQLIQYFSGLLASRTYLYCSQDETLKKISLYKPAHFLEIKKLLWLFQKGVPSFFQKGSEIFAFTGLILLAGAYSSNALILENVVQQFLLGALLMPMMSIAQITVKLCGQPYGQLKALLQKESLSEEDVHAALVHIQNVKTASTASIINNMALMLGLSAILCACSSVFSNAFLTENQQTDDNYQTLRVLFGILIASQTFDGMRNSLGAISNALTNTSVPMMTSFVLSLGFNLLFAWALAFRRDYGVIGLQFGPAASFLLSNIILGFYVGHRLSALPVAVHEKAGPLWPASLPKPTTLGAGIKAKLCFFCLTNEQTDQGSAALLNDERARLNQSIN